MDPVINPFALGAGPHRSGDIADQLQREVTALGPTRNQLIAKGMIWPPTHGETVFTLAAWRMPRISMRG